MAHFKVFFANRTQDQESVDRLLRNLSEALPNCPIKNLSALVPKDPEHWQEFAEPLISECDAFVCVVGRDTHSSEPVAWEISNAIANKRYIAAIHLDREFKVPEKLTNAGVELITWNPDRVPEYLSNLLVTQALFPQTQANGNEPDVAMIWNQYNLAVQTWENLINRRQTVNTLYMSICGGLLAAMGALFSAADKADPQAVSTGGVIFSLLGVMVCANWKKTLKSYGALSAAKSQIVSALERRMPARLFDAEWKVLEAGKYVSTTRSDGQTVNILSLLFGAISATALGSLLWHWISPLSNHFFK